MERFLSVGHVTNASFLRLAAIAEAVKTADRVVYLDTDTLVFEDLEIERLDMDGRPVAAVLDMDLSSTGVFRKEVDHGFHDPAMRSRYFNSGVMVFDTSRWEDAFLGRFADAMAEQETHCRYKLNCPPNDQCASNILFENDWTPLPFTYNFQAGGKFTQGWQSAKVRHYCGPSKFLPVTLRRNDPRDLAVIGEISRRLGLRAPSLVLLHAIAFRLNAWRNRAYAQQMRRFIRFAEPREA
ncbi:glycosyltransferase family 8 protein [Plastoroseomonas arctica]|uniref:Nucleotide-diphospho-sugar transferase domain-containing protein n=1 Tax=Plastoroseomonas arctica TaxID=1509237 RepID=A0AAF1JY85_9PROT|nr:glycosyltransferase [Plastoroseomonas arctica]MBR0654743.1 hypothetical protein [Plastoroseomonas arctica]